MIEGWDDIDIAVERLGAKTRHDGSAPARCAEVGRLFDAVGHARLPHQEAYKAALLGDLRAWYSAGGAPDFTRSRDAWWPVPGDEPWLLAFPARLANASGAMRFDAAVGRRLPLPDSVARMKPARMVPSSLEACTSGWGDHSAVHFPEMVAAPRPPAKQAWAVFFCARQAARFARFLKTTGLVDLTHLGTALAEPDDEAVVVGDACHDRGHDSGPIPYETRLGERMPIELEAIEELRADLVAHAIIPTLDIDAGLRDRAALYLMIDRALRFSITNPGSFDDYAGETLLAILSRADGATWLDGRWSFDLPKCRAAMAVALADVTELYEGAQDRAELATGARALQRRFGARWT